MVQAALCSVCGVAAGGVLTDGCTQVFSGTVDPGSDIDCSNEGSANSWFVTWPLACLQYKVIGMCRVMGFSVPKSEETVYIERAARC